MSMFAEWEFEAGRPTRMPAMKRSFPAEPESLQAVRAFIRERAHEASLHTEDADDLVQAVSEICANAVLHTGSREFAVLWSVRPGAAAEIKVSDQGVFAPRAFRGRAGGFGLPLAAALVDEVSIARGTPAEPGTTVRLVKYPART
jgi:anti-sigma regulatory factor (Ser/Thr protein kinase)